MAEVTDLDSDVYNVYYSSGYETRSFTNQGTKSGLAAPATAPTVSVTSVGATSASIRWNLVERATRYEIELNGVILGDTNNLSFSQNKLTTNQPYVYRVRAINPAGESDWSNSITVRTLLEKPTVEAAVYSDSVRLFWNDVQDATTYQIEVDGAIIENGVNTNYTHSNLLPSTSHKYRVRAQNGDLFSEWTNLVTLWTTPIIPTNIVANSTSSAITLNWTSVAGATGYDVEVNGTTTATSTNSFTKNNLSPNTSHIFRIRAKNVGSTSEWTSEIIKTTLLATPSITGASTSSTITLTWPSIQGAANYEVDVDGSIIDVGNNPSYTHSDLAANTSHTYKVRAKSADNSSAWTNAITRSTSPAEPTNVNANSTSTSVTLTWTAITGATGYDVEVDGTVVSSSNISYTKNSLTPNTSHTFRVRSKNAGGVSNWTPVLEKTTLLTTPTVTGASTSSTITLTWSVIQDAVSYEVDVDGSIIDIGNILSYTHSGLASNTSHTYKVRAKSADNASAWTSAITRSTSPAEPTNVSASSTSSSVILTWIAAPGATGYDVEVDGVTVSSSNTSYTKSSLTPNTAHTFRVRSKNAGGVSDWTPVLEKTTLLTTPVVTGASTSSTITLTWPSIQDAVSYEVDVYGSIIDIGNILSYIQSGLTANTSHTYKVRAKSADNVSAWTNAITRSTSPAEPTNVSASSTSTSVTLTWTASTGATGYDVEVDGTMVSTSGTAVSYTKNSLAPNTMHTFRVRSKNAGGVSDWTPVLEKTTLLTTPTVTVASTSSTITLTWPAIQDAASYEVDVDGSINDIGNNPSYTHSGLAANTSHTYKVRAKSADNASAWTSAISRSTSPTLPTNVSASNTSTSITLTWIAAPGATGYDVEVDGVVVSPSGIAVSYTKGSLTPNTTHTFRVRSKNAGGVSDWTPVLEKTTLLATPTVTGASTSSTITLTWPAIQDAASYEVDVDGSINDIGNNPSYTHSGLAANTSHTYKVRAKSADNASAWTSIISRSTSPTLPTNVSASNTSTSITLTWIAAPGATGYDVEVDGAVVSPSGIAVSYTKGSLTPNTTHTFRVRSKNAGGVSDWTPVLEKTTLLTTPTVTGASSSSTITLAWFAIQDAVSYEVDVDGSIIDIGNILSYTHSGLAANTSHTFKVRAKSADNASAWTSEISRSTSPATPTNVSASSTSSSVILTWTAAPGATGYDVEVDGVTVSSSNTSYTKNSLTPNTAHTFRVRSKNAGGVSDWTPVLEKTTLLTTPVVTGASTSSTITLTWPSIQDAVSYEVDVYGSIIDIGNILSYIQSGLTANTSHTYKVRAKSADNVSAWTNAITRSTSPAEPTNVSASSTSTSVTLTWTASTGATGYDVEVDGTMVSTSGTAVSYTKNSLAPNTMHTFRVRSKNAGGVSDWTPVLEKTTLLTTPTVTVASTSSTITLTWPAIQDAASYEVDVDGSINDIGNNPSYTHSSLAANTSHTYKVRAKSADNASAWTSAISRSTSPTLPTNVSASSTSTSITLTWTAAPGATGYDVEVDGIVVSSSNTSYTKNSLTPNTTHTFRVRSKNAGGVSDWTPVLEKTTLLATPTVTGASTSSTITLAWPATQDAVSYEVDVDGSIIDIGNNPSYTHSGLAANTSHTYKVRAKSADNVSVWTNAITRSTSPAEPTNVSASSTSTSITFTWTAAIGATGYDVEVDGIVVSSSKTSYTKNSLAPNTVHTFRVRSKNTGGVSDWTLAIEKSTLS
ncbi:fibronectin type III domain-containing protein [Paenibacillus silviterrae]|uniref:fibronectin type III domain-containing protein n=1 Tax=Paenibacillus silviterrae TaxID=3242194 RepID=UPI003555D204